MLRLAKYIKPYTTMLLLAIVLLFAQANFDLALPDYLSRIVNNGIQQSGVENAVPVAIRQSEMDRVVLFMSVADKASVLKDYTLVDKNSADYATYVKQYPALANQPVYVLNKIDKAEIDRLNPIMAKGILAVSTIEKVMADPAKAAQMGSQLGFDVSKIPPGTDFFALLGKLPATQLSQMTDAVNKQFEVLGDKMVVQAAIAPVKAEYEALGMDTAKLQNKYILNVGGIMLLLTLLSGLCTITVGYLSAKIAAGSARDIRKRRKLLQRGVQ